MIVRAVLVWNLSHSSGSKRHAIASRTEGSATRAGPIADSVRELSCGYPRVILRGMGRLGSLILAVCKTSMMTSPNNGASWPVLLCS